MSDRLLPEDILDTLDTPEVVPDDSKAMIQEIIEYEIGFMMLSDLLASYKTTARERYEAMDYLSLCKVYNDMFGGIYE